ncbi:hypothetical protein P8X24_11615 [Pyrococcus kukulkanii]|uniref:hypothetical protein n=1 Tax=Pyrococcus kukulkanii TaxID=1609559 RepID=UPI003561E2F5
MKKSMQNLIVGLFLVGLLVVGYFVVAKGNGGGFIDLSSILNKEKNTTENENVTASVSVSDIKAKVLETGEALISFKVIASNANISNVSVYYALNVANPENATYSPVEAKLENDTYKATLPSKFGDILYYYIKVEYRAGNETKTYKTETYHIQVKDTYAPVINSITIDYNGTAKQFVINFNASDNDVIYEYIVHYAESNTTDFSNATFVSMNSTSLPIVINATENYYYAFYFEVEDLSGNTVALFNETEPLILQANATSSWPVIVNGTG